MALLSRSVEIQPHIAQIRPSPYVSCQLNSSVGYSIRFTKLEHVTFSIGGNAYVELATLLDVPLISQNLVVLERG